jgi:hypothetical protein
MPLVLLYTCVTIISHTHAFTYIFFCQENTQFNNTNNQLHFARHWCLLFRYGQEIPASSKGIYTYIFTELDIYTSSERYICSCAMFWLATIHLVLQNFRNFRTNIVNPACYVQRCLG